MDIGAFFSEMNRISDVTGEELLNFQIHGDRSFWLQDIAIPLFTVNYCVGSKYLPFYYKHLTLAEVVEWVKRKAINTEEFDLYKPVISVVVPTKGMRLIGFFGTPRKGAYIGDWAYSVYFSDMEDEDHEYSHITTAMYLFSYINRIFLTQPPRKGKTRIEKVHETLLNGQVISHPQKVTFYQLPAPEQINHRKIAAYQREWHCPAWGVRGHYRHYKSGKVVFIKSYVKGKDKSKYEGREYDIGLVAKGGTGR